MPEFSPPSTGASCTIELYGPARLIAGTSRVELSLDQPTPANHVLAALARRCPSLVGTIITADGIALAPGYQLNCNGRDFLRQPNDIIRPGDRLLILCDAAGG